MEPLVALVVLGGLIWLVWFASQPRPLFVIRVSNGIPRVVRGKVTDSFLKGVAEVCRLSDTSSGTIKAFRDKHQTRIRCSGGISPGCLQQLRNMIHAGS